jgi:hypothetical protein
MFFGFNVADPIADARVGDGRNAGDDFVHFDPRR